jgi:NADH-quinone oxidoreductase subunit L
MFRSYYMTFYRRQPTAEMRAHVHESPRSMTYVLWALAVLAVGIGVLGIPALWTGGVTPVTQIFEHFVIPTMNLAPFRAATNSHLLEGVLMLASVGIALAGWQLARYYYFDEATSAVRMERLRARYNGAHRLLYNKYWVDEIYQATFVRGFGALARACAWVDKNMVDWLVNATGYAARGAAWVGGWIDRTFVDGAVNGLAEALLRGGRQLRRVQTGRINNYAVGIGIGVLVLAVVSVVAL